MSINKEDWIKLRYLITLLGENHNWWPAKVISGKRLYKYAKQGITDIELPKVTSQIDSIKLLNYSFLEKDGKSYPLINLEIGCSSGTYIRAIANHLGDILGTKGVLYSLKRTKVGDFSINESQNVPLD